MTRILLLSYFFPPIGGAGVQRSVKLTKHLGEHGYEMVVVTGPGAPMSRWTPLDPSLSTDVPTETTILRARGPIPEESSSRLQRLRGGVTPFRRWWCEAAVEAASEAPAVAGIIATMSPFESAFAAAEIAATLEVPWIADLRDPWALDEMIVYPTRVHRARERKVMRRALATAAAITMNTPEARDRLLTEFPELGNRPVVTIPNGFDAHDFSSTPPSPRTDGRFRIIHSGYLHTSLGREHRQRSALRRLAGGSTPGVDFLTRSHLYLLAAIDALTQEDPDLADLIDVHLAGALTEDDESAIAGHRVIAHGYLPHDQTVDLMRTADLLFLPMHDLPLGTRATIVPGKTYEYLAAGAPILAAVPDGDARDLLRSSGNAELVRPGDVGAMTRALKLAVERWRRGEPAAPPNPFVIARYERRRVANEMASLLDAVTGQSLVMATAPSAGATA